MKSAVRWLRTHRIGVALGCVFLAGFFLRIWGLSSAYQRIDDIPVAKQIYHVYLGDWAPDPVQFYPVFFSYIVGVLLRLLSHVLAFLGIHHAPGWYEFTLDQALLVARLTSAALGSLTILVVFRIGKKLFSDSIGLAAAFFFGFSFIHILYSHQIVLDVPMTFFYALSLYFCVLILKDGRWPSYLAASLLAGLATAAKYNGMFIVLSILAAHVWKKRETQKNVLKILLDKKIWTAGLVSILGFFLGHPYALLWFKTFIQATRELTKWVHNTEYYLILVKPRALLEKIAESNYVKGLGNILSAEGWILCLLVVLGIVWAVRTRKKETAFLSLSGLIYFFATLGYLGFSRLRDLSTLAVFYAFFAAFGLTLLGELLKKKKFGKAAFAVLSALILFAVGLRSLGRGYYLHEDDTTQIAERWIKRNLPPGSVIGREWFTADFPDPASRFQIFTRPYLWRDGLPSHFGQFDLIESSSASAGFFLKYRKYYPDQVAVYDDLDRNHELLKDFHFKDFEFKNPEVKIYSGKFGRRPKLSLALPSMPAQPTPPREFEILDGSPYGKDINGFFLKAGESVERIFISRTKIDRLAVFVRSPEGAGEITVRSGSAVKRIKVETGRDAVLLLSPMRAFPFYEYFYKIKLFASDRLEPCFVRICADDLSIALELFGSRDYVRAGEFFRRALETASPANGAGEIPLYLAACARMTGRSDEERGLVKKFVSGPQAARLSSVCRALTGNETWAAAYEEYAGIPLSFFSAIQTVWIDDDQFSIENGTALVSESFLGRKAWGMSPESGGPMIALSPALRLPPQAYVAEFLFFNPTGFSGAAGEVEIVMQRGAAEERRAIPLSLEAPGGDRMSKGALVFTKDDYSGTIRFRLRLSKGPDIAFDGLAIRPDLRAFLIDRYSLFKDYLK